MAKVGPKAPTPKVQVIREVLRAFADIPDKLGLSERSSFETLKELIDDCVLEENCLRKVTIHYLKNDEIMSEMSFEIDWRKRVISSSDGGPDIMIDNTRDIVSQVGQKLAAARDFFVRMVENTECDRADWFVTLREDSDHLKSFANKTRERYNLEGISDEYKKEIKIYKEAEKEGVVGTADKIDFLSANFSYKVANYELNDFSLSIGPSKRDK